MVNNMKKITLTLFILLIFFVQKSDAQNTEHIKTILTTYQTSLTELESKIGIFNNDSLQKNKSLKSLIITFKNLQGQKFNLDSAFIEYEYLSKRILLDQILTKKRLKRRKRKQLKEDLLKWNYNSCHPASDRLWHSVSKFFYHLETLSNAPYIQEDTFTKLLEKVKQQQQIASIILEDI
tara:strand:+ start:90 stop:626 length:537 start_codon:yes stop_codon:yes gene_type:complete